MIQPLQSRISCVIFARIKHGDDEHQQWLRDKCWDVAGEIIEGLKARGIVVPPDNLEGPELD